MSDPQRALRKKLLRKLDDAQFDYSGHWHLVGGEPHEVGTQSWRVRAFVSLSTDLPEDVELDLPDVEFESPEDELDGRGSHDAFFMSGFTIDLCRVGNLFDALDSRDADAAHFLPLVESYRSSELNSELLEQIEGLGSRLVIVDRVHLVKPWRGLGGVGRLLIGHALEWIAGDACCIATQPHPTELRDEEDPAFAAELAKVRHVWSSLGFWPFREDIYVLDPHKVAMAEAMKGLSARLLS